MKIYKVAMCLQMAIPRLKSFDLKEYAATRPILFVEAHNPDEACHKVMSSLISLILSQDDSLETKLLCKDIINDVRVITAKVPE
jgi:hypothetical protein